MKAKKLPDKLSKLLQVAMEDLELCENDPRYVIDMRDWHNPNGQCAVCLAGSVMAKSLGEDPNDPYVSINNYNSELQNKMLALNNIRCGEFALAFNNLDHDFTATTLPDDYVDFTGVYSSLAHLSRNDRPEWKLHMQSIIGILEAEGL